MHHNYLDLIQSLIQKKEQIASPWGQEVERVDLSIKKAIEILNTKQNSGKSLGTDKETKKEIEVNSYGRVIREISSDPSQKGKNINISIDSRLQKFTYEELKEHKAGSIVVLEIDSGEILSMVSTPSYDANLIIKKPNTKYSKK